MRCNTGNIFVYSSPSLLSTIFLGIAMQATLFGQPPRRIQVRVVNEVGEPVEGAIVKARYLATVAQEGREYQVPMELAGPQKTDLNGRCELTLKSVSWTNAGLYAHRAELTTDEAIKLYERARIEPLEGEALARDVEDRSRRFSVAYLQLPPGADDEFFELKMEKAVRITGRIQVNGRPLAGALVTIYSKQTPIDSLFARAAPERTDPEGRFDYYAVPGELDRARIIVERLSGNRVLNLDEIRSETTPAGRVFEIETDAKKYALVNSPE